MAKKKPQDGGAEPELPRLPGGGGSEVDEIAQAESDPRTDLANKELEEILGELGSGARVRVQRVNFETGTPAWVGDIPASGFSLEVLADTFGGGRYYLTIFVGKEQKGGRHIQEIDNTIPPRNPRAPRGAVAPSSGGTANDILLSIMAASAESSKRMMESMGVMMQGFATAMTARPEKDPLDVATKLIELTRPQGREARPMSELREMMEFVETARGPGGGDGDGTMAVVSKAIDTVGDIVKRTPIPAQVPPRVAVPPRPAAAIAPTAPVVQSPPVPGDIPVLPSRPWLDAIQPHLTMLRTMAGSINPGTVADIIADKFTDDQWVDLIADIVAGMTVGQPITIETVGPFARGAAQRLGLSEEQVPWLAEVVKEVLEIENDSVEDDAIPPGGDGGQTN